MDHDNDGDFMVAADSNSSLCYSTDDDDGDNAAVGDSICYYIDYDYDIAADYDTLVILLLMLPMSSCVSSAAAVSPIVECSVHQLHCSTCIGVMGQGCYKAFFYFFVFPIFGHFHCTWCNIILLSVHYLIFTAVHYSWPRCGCGPALYFQVWFNSFLKTLHT